MNFHFASTGFFTLLNYSRNWLSGFNHHCINKLKKLFRIKNNESLHLYCLIVPNHDFWDLLAKLLPFSTMFEYKLSSKRRRNEWKEKKSVVQERMRASAEKITQSLLSRACLTPWSWMRLANPKQSARSGTFWFSFSKYLIATDRYMLGYMI